MTAAVSTPSLHHSSQTSTSSPSLYAEETLPTQSPCLKLAEYSNLPSISSTIPKSSFPVPNYYCGAPLHQQQVVPILESHHPESQLQIVEGNVTAVVRAENCQIDDEISAPRDFVPRVKDQNLLEDERVLCNLLNSEDKIQPKKDYFQTVQMEVKPRMRTIVTQWMSDVCEEEHVDREIFPLACNYLDRFLSIEPVYKSQLQGLACTCLFVASKIKQPQPISARKLVDYTDNYVPLGQLMSWELLLLNRLGWDVSTVTAFDFLDHLFYRMQLPSCLVSKMRPLINEFIKILCTEFQLAILPPSLQACICICLAGIRVLEDSEALPNLLGGIHSVLGIDPESLRIYVEMVDAFLMSKNNNDEWEENRETTGNSVTVAESAA